MEQSCEAAIVVPMGGRRRIVIAGGGVAALEAMLELHELAPEFVDVELVAPEPRFWYRPLAVAEPFGLGDARSFDLADLAQRANALVTLDGVVGVDARQHVALAASALLLACGAVPQAGVPGALTFRGPADTSLIVDVLTRIDRGLLERIVVAVPRGAAWSLPAYELALMLAAHIDAADLDDVRVALVTPEDEPLLLFGAEATHAVRTLLSERRVALHTGFSPAEVRDGELHLLPSRAIEADCVIVLPTLRGQPIDGVPQTRDGFVVVDDHGRVRGVPDVYAAGDITLFPVKQGGIATQQADAAAEAILADAGFLERPAPFRPVLRGLLLTGSAPQFLRRDVAAGQRGVASVDPLWWPPAKLVGRRLAPFLAQLTDPRTSEPPAAPDAVEVEVKLGDAELARAGQGPPEIDETPDDESPTVEGVMVTDFLTVEPEDTLGEVAERMQRQHTGSALVTESGTLIGILTSRDLVRAFAGRIHSSEARVREWMTAEPISTPPDGSLTAALRLMHEHAIHHLPVVVNERPVGVVGMRNVAGRIVERRSRSHIGLGF
jgi:sulfide:quinone oxidoreductase